MQSNFLKIHDLNIRMVDANLVINKYPNLLKKLQKLTLHNYSGMSRELKRLQNISISRKAKMHFILAYKNSKLIAWALLSKEDTDFYFAYSGDHYQSSYGWLFEVFVNPKFRQRGVGTALFNRAKKKIQNEKICVCPWDAASHAFYKKLADHKTNYL